MGLEKEFKKGVSIIIPTWNCAPVLQECLNSIIDAFPWEVPLEVIIVDKSSTDKTRKIVHDWMQEHYISTYIIRENGPLGAARLAGIKKAKYSTIFWLDADIVLPPDYIKNLFKMMQEYPRFNVGQIQGQMIDTVPLIAHWWMGYDAYLRRKSKTSYIIAKSNAPTACSLLLKGAVAMSSATKRYMKTLHSTEDSLLASVIQNKGYVQLMFPIEVKHRIKEVDLAEGSHKMVWSLVGLKNRGYGKLTALWKMKWIWRNGYFAFTEYRTLDLIAYTISIQLNLIRACIKDKRIIEQRRLVTLKEW